MLILTIVTVLGAFGLAFTGPIQNDGVKSASVPVGVKGHDYSIKYSHDHDQSGESRIVPQASPVQPQGVWPSRPVIVQPGQVDAAQDGSYVPVIDVRPQPKWYHHEARKQQLAPGDLVIEQRKEEPAVVSNYESGGVVSVNGEVYDPYKDILPDVLTGKRRLSEDDAAVVGQSDSGSVSSVSTGGVRAIPVTSTVNAGEVSSSPGKVPSRSVFYGDKNVPQHAYTEDSFPSIITVKGRQYVIIPKQISDKVSPLYSPTQYPWQWGYSAAHHGVQQSPGYESYVYQSGPTKVSYSIPGAGHGYSVYGNRQVIHGQSQGVAPVADAGHPGQVSDIYKTYAGWAGHNVRRQQPASSVYTGSSVASSSGYERPSSVHPDYAPYVHTQYVHKIPYRHGYHHQSVYYPQQSPYYGFPVQVPVSHVSKVPVGVSHGTRQNWAWVLAPQYVGDGGVEGGNWVVKGVQPGKGIAEGPAVAVGGLQVDGQQDVKQVFKTVETEKTKVVQSSPDIKQVPGKNWLIYSPSSAPWSYGWGQPQPSWYDRPWFAPVVPQYSGQWPVDGEKVAQWSSSSVEQSWPVKAQSPSASGITVENQGVVQAPVVKQPVQVATVSTDKVQSVESVPSVPVNSPQVQQASVSVGAGSGAVSYALQIDHSSGGKYSFQQGPTSSEGEKKS